MKTNKNYFRVTVTEVFEVAVEDIECIETFVQDAQDGYISDYVGLSVNSAQCSQEIEIFELDEKGALVNDFSE